MNKTPFFQKPGIRSVLASVISILIGLLAGSILIWLVGVFNPTISANGIWQGIQLVFAGLFSISNEGGTLIFGFNPTNIGNMLFRATPLILTGLSVAVAFKTGLFNIGAPGQYLAGTAASLFIALSMSTGAGRLYDWQVAQNIAPTAIYPVWLVWTLAFIGGMMAGAIWGAIPGLLKSLLNINEVLACIMTNWIAANLVTWAFDISNLKNVIEGTKTSYIYKTSFNNVETAKMGLDKLFPDSQVNGGILIAIVLAVIIYVILTRTTFGYQLKACGSNRFAARYAGIADKRNIVMSMAIAGSLAGAAGALYSLSGNTEFFWTTYQQLPAVGFNGIPVALLASNHPIGVIFTGLFMSMLDICGQMLTKYTAYNEYITDVIIAVIVYMSAFALLIKTMLGKRRRKAAGDTDAAGTGTEAADAAVADADAADAAGAGTEAAADAAPDPEEADQPAAEAEDLQAAEPQQPAVEEDENV
ncbi:MAG: ABC transporter permease [Clostridia bacterium]|nr:ABC transporter permease [Clostridia bacterium]